MCLGELVEVVGVPDGDTVEVSHAGRQMAVSLMVLDEPVAVGDWLVVHAGFALERVTTAEAQEAARIRAATGFEEESG